MRTTVRLDPELLKRAKALAAATNRSMTGLIEDALRQMLERREAPAEHMRFEMITATGNGVRPGVDLDDSASLWDVVESDAPRRR